MQLCGSSFLVLLVCLGESVSGMYNVSEDATPDHMTTATPKIQRRKKRFLLFPPGANILLTSSFGKGLVFRGPAGYAVVGELDLYYPLPDYKYQASALKLGKIAMYPPEPKKKPPPPPPPPSPPPPPPMMAHEHGHDHHDGSELSPAEVEQYLKDHPNTWVPPGWGKERADWNLDNPYQYRAPPQSPYWATSRVDGYTPVQSSPVLDRYLGAGAGSSPDYYAWSERHQPGRYPRSILEAARQAEEVEDRARAKWLSGEAFNISHHSDWEHFHHYRDRRALFDHLEETIGSITGFHMKDCILRSICEAKNMLPPPGRSMTMDLFRVLFSFPLNEALDDDYSNAMRDENVNCGQRYGSGCPMSLLDLVLFGKFET
ncbi:uncharacterized protein LOC118456311 [Anopheles albimanus]|uniref:uncharacterized protein LOC118456311 n=1 Tax=Anopheles albimanus TaxID=7167 RepID=UPI001640FB87|nr:uncharacterized protein LOC118456311 [Anopheles albimanus]